MNYHVELKFTEPLLGSAPANREVYTRFIAGKNAEAANEEVEMLPEERMESGLSVLRRDPDTLALMLLDYHIRGFLKEAASAVTGKQLTAYKSKIDKFVFVAPRKLLLYRDQKVLMEPDGVLERPIRAMTMMGPRVSLKSSEMIKPGAELGFDLTVLALGEKEFTQEILQSWLDYGQYQGLGEWRNGSYGRFTASLAMKEKSKAKAV